MNIIYNILLIAISTSDLEPQNHKEYCSKYLMVAYLCEVFYGVPVSVQLSQAIHESGGGKSYISKNSNNHFGIKYYKSEYKGNYFIDRAGVKWRAYDSVWHSYIDHAKFLKKHYRKACYKNYKYWGKLKGYGERNYWGKIVKTIENKKLYKLDYHE